MQIKSFYLLFCFLILSNLSKAQAPLKTFSKELTVITDNDNYDFEFTDRYYSNGFIINFNWLAKTSTGKKYFKKINRLEAGHKVFNPYKNNESTALVLQNMDRPYAGWLYGSYGITKIYKKSSVLLYGGTLGIMGPSARGRQIQKGWHKFIGLYDVYGWEYQLNNEIGLNGNIEYYHSLLQSTGKNNISIHLVSKANLGNTFTNASAGFLIKTGKLNTEEETGYWSANLTSNTKAPVKKEIVFFLEPTVMFQGYNATLQGGLFRKDKGPYTSTIKPVIAQAKIGAIIPGNAAGLRIYYTFRTREGGTMKLGEHWGSIGLTVRFR